MDAHFNEYLAAMAGMQELYGERGDEHPSDFHAEHPVVSSAAQDAIVVAA
jgi:hypothetical protein